MKKRIVALFVLAALLLTVLCGCGSKKDVLSASEAEQIVIEHFQINKADITNVHSHIAATENPSYSIHITCGDTEYSALVDVVTGEISESDH